VYPFLRLRLPAAVSATPWGGPCTSSRHTLPSVPAPEDAVRSIFNMAAIVVGIVPASGDVGRLLVRTRASPSPSLPQADTAKKGGN
jgi:hypothetical protein